MSTRQSQTPVEWLPLSDQVYLALKAEIASGEIAPGTFCREVELGRRFGVSRTPIREAMRRLQAEGLLESTRRGFVVTSVDVLHLADAYEVRALMEGMAARLAAERRTQADGARLRDLLESMEEAIAQGDEETHAALNSQFHSVVARASRNTYLLEALADIADLFERHRLPAVADPDRRMASHGEHRELARAIADQDAAAARDVAERHVQNALKFRIASGHFS